MVPRPVVVDVSTDNSTQLNSSLCTFKYTHYIYIIHRIRTIQKPLLPHKASLAQWPQLRRDARLHRLHADAPEVVAVCAHLVEICAVCTPCMHMACSVPAWVHSIGQRGAAKRRRSWAAMGCDGFASASGRSAHPTGRAEPSVLSSRAQDELQCACTSQ